jgi:hypothetical protein
MAIKSRNGGYRQQLSRRIFIKASLVSVAASAAGVAQIRTAAESAAGVAPTYSEFSPGDVRRYGAILDGKTDDSAALAKWAKVGGNLIFPVALTARITTAIRLVGNTTITAIAGATIETATADISFLVATGQSRISSVRLRRQESASLASVVA